MNHTAGTFKVEIHNCFSLLGFFNISLSSYYTVSINGGGGCFISVKLLLLLYDYRKFWTFDFFLLPKFIPWLGFVGGRGVGGY